MVSIRTKSMWVVGGCSGLAFAAAIIWGIYIAPIGSADWHGFAVLALCVVSLWLLITWRLASALITDLSKLGQALRRMGDGRWDFQIRRQRQDELGQVYYYLNLATQQISAHFAAHLTKARFQKEKEVAHAVHGLLSAKDEIRCGGMTISGFSTAAKECGGDWWGHFSGGHDCEYIVIADAMGHGVQAALVTAMVKSASLTLISLANRLGTQSASQFLKQLNTVVCGATEGAISATVTVLRIDLRDGILELASGGHVPAILIPRDSQDDRAPKHSRQRADMLTPITLKLAGTILGVSPEASFEEIKLPIKHGDRILLYTDGLIECCSPQQKAWGRKNLLSAAVFHASKSAVEMNREIIAEAFSHYGGQPLQDDLTLVAIEFERPVRPRNIPPALPVPMPALIAVEEAPEECDITLDLGEDTEPAQIYNLSSIVTAAKKSS